ncbi:hypothetical protein FVE85_3436 [Porphyridium purpureum]|uniref:Uncharacterized protein n=1 Tax=Porphyridium purpureum TaxID=35688 RepID=A0A5J4YVA4_PORPP|nr:hypothetical protein FVE85_3436 [Porphyridium purpureum]|eukprot:POR3985..scf227_4
MAAEAFADLARGADFQTHVVGDDVRRRRRRMTIRMLDMELYFAVQESGYCTRLLQLRFAHPMKLTGLSRSFKKSDPHVGASHESDAKICACCYCSTSFGPDVLMGYICEWKGKLVNISVDLCDCFPSDVNAVHRLDLSNTLILAQGMDKKIRKASHTIAEEYGQKLSQPRRRKIAHSVGLKITFLAIPVNGWVCCVVWRPS